MLMNEGLVSIDRTGQIITEITGGLIKLSSGTMSKWNKDLSHKLMTSNAEIKDSLFVSPVANKDETGIRVKGKTIWLHVLSNAKRTLYHVSAKRGNEADKEMGVLTAYSGVLVHDHLKGLYANKCKHAECNAHILRYLKSAVENQKREWATKMIDLLVSANNAVKEAKAKGETALLETKKSEFESKYSDILEDGRQEFLRSEGCDYNGEDMKLLRRMKEYKTEHLRFLGDFAVPFDNNQAERDLRMIKTKMKVSGCFRSDTGASGFAAIKSYTSTLRKNGKNIFEGIKYAYSNSPISFEG
jgi:transposase